MNVTVLERHLETVPHPLEFAVISSIHLNFPILILEFKLTYITFLYQVLVIQYILHFRVATCGGSVSRVSNISAMKALFNLHN